MADLSGLILLLLPLAAATGWFAARHSRRPEDEEPAGIDPEYVRGLSHLVNNDTDQAVEVFIGMLEADTATIDLHLALGSLFRRRGEVDRALRIHQNLVMRPRLKPVHRNQARYELAKDYFAAGVLDRAEEIFLELARQGMFLNQCLARLMQIYEREREWDQAIDTARWLASAKGQDQGPVVAQYFCEKADAAARRGDDKARQQALKQALQADPHCVRALLIKAAMARESGRHRVALRLYRDILRHHPEFRAEVLPRMAECYALDRATERWISELEELYQREPAPELQMALLEAREAIGLDPLGPLLDELRLCPSWVGLHAALSRPWPNADERLQSILSALSDNLAAPLKRSPRYRCHHCGYSAQVLDWQCPSCRQWNSTRPLPDLSYEALDTAAHGASAIGNNPR